MPDSLVWAWVRVWGGVIYYGAGLNSGMVKGRARVKNGGIEFPDARGRAWGMMMPRFSCDRRHMAGASCPLSLGMG